MSTQPKKTYTHIVRERYCKGCGICVAFCPRKVLALKSGKVCVEHPELCIGCRMCELRCPDFAIEVEEKIDRPPEEGDEGFPDLSLPPEAHHA
jgi:2-oxoglutarate ferredoxin oxidoreductase subunit delta